MEFFRGFFGREGKQDLDSEIEKKKKELSSRKESGMSRRDFLKIAGAALASTSFDRIQPEKSKSERIMVEKESDNAYQELIASLQNAKEEFNVGDPESFIPENNLRIHDEFLRKYGGVLEHFFTQVGKNIPHIDSAEGQKRFLGMMEKVFQETSLFRAQGTVYSFLERHNLYEVFRTVMKPENFLLSHYQVKTRDFLPESQHITSDEIDPLQKRERFAQVSSVYAGIPEEKRKESWWGHEEAQNLFRKLLDSQEKELGGDKVRALLQKESDLSLAGAYSLIKAAIRYKADIDPARSYPEIVQQLLVERHEFENQEILSAQRQVLRFYGSDPIQKGLFDRRPIDEVIETLHVSDSQVFEAEKDPEAGGHFIEALSGAQSSLTVLVDSHGSAEEWKQGKSENVEGNIRVDGIAQALFDQLQRSYATGGEEALQDIFKDMVLLADACYAYDFMFKNLSPALTKLVESSSLSSVLGEHIPLPRVISTSQEGSVVSGMLGGVLQKYSPVFQIEGKIRGRDLLALVEPEIYTAGDLTISSVQFGKLHQISQLEKQPVNPDSSFQDRVAV